MAGTNNNENEEGKGTIPPGESPIHAGFPAATDGYDFLEVDLNRHLISNRHATFLARVKGNAMRSDAGITEGDILVIDRSRPWASGAIAVCTLNNEFTVKRITKTGGQWYLEPPAASAAPSDPAAPAAATHPGSPVPIQAHDELVVWGVVTYIIHPAAAGT